MSDDKKNEEEKIKEENENANVSSNALGEDDEINPRQDISRDSEETEEGEVAHLQEQLAEVELRFKRALADYQNLERHVSEQRAQWAQQSAKQIILKLLPVLDTLMLTQKHLQDKGLQVTINQFLQILKDEGVDQIKTVGEKFDPAFMECIETREGDENIVLEETRAGYTMESVVLQPAQVIVGSSQRSS